MGQQQKSLIAMTSKRTQVQILLVHFKEKKPGNVACAHTPNTRVWVKENTEAHWPGN